MEAIGDIIHAAEVMVDIIHAIEATKDNVHVHISHIYFFKK